MHKSLKGIKVIDLTQSVAGPFATQILGDFGAEVIKVEKMDGGDDTRRWGPPFWGDQSPHFLAYNRNKLSISLNLKIESDLLIFKEMIKEADVFVQNLRPGALDKLGLDESEIFKLNSKIIYCSINAFGHTGDYKNKPGYDPLLQAFSGLMSLNGEENGEPVRIPASILDQGTAMWCVIAIQNALRNRDLTGEGSRIETSLLNTALMWLPAQYIGYFADGTVPQKNGSGTVGIAPYQAYPTKDGHIIIAAGNEKLWEKLCKAIDRLDLLNDSRFKDNPTRVENKIPLYKELSDTLKSENTDFWDNKISKNSIPVTPIYSLNEVVAHDQVNDIQGFFNIKHNSLGDIKLVQTPFVINGKYLEGHLPPPELNEHGEQIRAKYKLVEEEV